MDNEELIRRLRKIADKAIAHGIFNDGDDLKGYWDSRDDYLMEMYGTTNDEMERLGLETIFDYWKEE